MQEPLRGRTVVIGVGNVLLGDDGIGLALLDRVRESYDVPADVQLVDAGSWSPDLLELVEQAGQLILLDAIDVGAPAGTPVQLERPDLPRHFAMRLEPHERELAHVLALAELHGRLPKDVVAIGVQPGSVHEGRRLSLDALLGLERAAAAVAARLTVWGFACQAHETAHA